jgi:hypothetical protein
VYGVKAGGKKPFVVGLHELQVLRKVSRSSAKCVALAGQQQKMQKQWCWSKLCHVVKPLTHICTFKLFKHEERFWKSWPHKNVSEILPEQDNARRHTSSKKHGKNHVILPRPTHNPDHAPSDLQYPFEAPKDAIRRQKCGSVDDVVVEVAASTKFKLV